MARGENTYWYCSANNTSNHKLIAYYSGVFTGDSLDGNKFTVAWDNYLGSRYGNITGQCFSTSQFVNNTKEQARTDRDGAAKLAKGNGFEIVFTDWTY